MEEIVVYTSDGCPFCEKAKCFLIEKGLEYKEIPTEPSTGGWVEMKKVTGGSSLPQLIVGGKPIGGYSDLVNMEATGELYERLGKPRQAGQLPLYDAIILGAGPAGLSAAIYTIRKGMKTLILSKDIGGQLAWTTDVENYLGFSQVNAAELVSKFQDHVRRFDVENIIGVDVVEVELAGHLKRIHTDDGRTFTGKTVIIATGGRHKPLEIPGEHDLIGRGVSYCSTCDAPLFAGADVAVVGGGNSAMGAVLDLIQVANKIYLIANTELIGDPVFQGKIQKSEKVEQFIEYIPVKVHGETSVQGIEIKSLKSGDVTSLAVEGVFVEIGILPNSTVFIDTLATNGRGEILVDLECRTGIAGVFAAGDVTNVPFKQVVVAVGEGSKAALSAYSYLLGQK